MTNSISLKERVRAALYGAFIGDALAMPVHWYYDTVALKRDYGTVDNYLIPRNPHPDSILWRSVYSPPNKGADILHDQKKYWGQRDVHYHQFLKAGENTLNIQLVRELLELIKQTEGYDPTSWLEQMVSFLTTPGQHNDTYVEEYLREFFINRSSGIPLPSCGRKDEKHIGGLPHMLPVLLAYARYPASAQEKALEHLELTHGGDTMKNWGQLIATILLGLLGGDSLLDACNKAVEKSSVSLDLDLLQSLMEYPDHIVVGRHFSSACYLEHAVPATIFLALKYREAPEVALIQNTMCGGDNAGRGAVLGALMGALHGDVAWPEKWITGLVTPPAVVLLD